MLKRLLPNDFRQSLKRKLFHYRDVFAILQNVKKLGFQPRGLIDGGAFEGQFVTDVWKLWRVPALIVEPNPSKRIALEAMSRNVPGSLHVPLALGKSIGTVNFSCDETNSRVVNSRDGVTVRMTTLDSLLELHSGFFPDFIKLDLQGNELDALAGASQSLQRFELILLEVSVIRIGQVPIFQEVQEFMNNCGFRFYDVVPQYYRPRDKALWQMDVFYVRNNSGLIQSNSWN